MSYWKIFFDSCCIQNTALLKFLVSPDIFRVIQPSQEQETCWVTKAEKQTISWNLKRAKIFWKKKANQWRTCQWSMSDVTIVVFLTIQLV